MVLFCSILWENADAQDTTKKKDSTLQVGGKSVPTAVNPVPIQKSTSDSAKAAEDKKRKDSLVRAKAICDSCIKNACDTCTTKICKPIVLPAGGSATLLVFLPFLLFGIIIWVLFSKLGKFSLQEALTENEYVKKTIKNPEYTAAAVTTLAGTSAAASVNTILPPTIDVTDIANNGTTTPGILSSHINDKKLTLANKLIDDKAANDKEQTSINALNDDNDFVKKNRQTVLNQKIITDKSKNDETQTEIDKLIILSTELPATPRASSSRFIALITSLLTLIIALCLCSFFIYFYIATGNAPDISKFSSVLLALGIGVVPYAFNKVATAITNKPTTNE